MAQCITLTTDFGTQDPYVAQLKGVLLSEGPKGLQIVDLSHDLAPFDVHAAALFVRAALPRFPTGTLHLAVVDPGVGSERRALIVSLRGMTLIGPDNCLFSYLFDGSEQVYAIDTQMHEWQEAGRTPAVLPHGVDLIRFRPGRARRNRDGCLEESPAPRRQPPRLSSRRESPRAGVARGSDQSPRAARRDRRTAGRYGWGHAWRGPN